MHSFKNMSTPPKTHVHSSNNICARLRISFYTCVLTFLSWLTLLSFQYLRLQTSINFYYEHLANTYAQSKTHMHTSLFEFISTLKTHVHKLFPWLFTIHKTHMRNLKHIRTPLFFPWFYINPKIHMHILFVDFISILKHICNQLKKWLELIRYMQKLNLVTVYAKS